MASLNFPSARSKMDEMQTYEIGRHTIVLAAREGVGPVSPYSLLLAENISDLTGQTVVDVGSGSGFLAILAKLQGAERVYLLDTYDSAIASAIENAERNGVREGIIHLPIGTSMVPLPEGERVNLILSNPAQLPLPQPEKENSPFYAGPEGRFMIDELIKEAPGKLTPSGRLLITHNSMANLPKSLRLLESLGMQHRILAERALPFRSFIDRNWLDTLGGETEGLYFVKEGVAYERLFILEARGS
jgi:methylase of polypeptide subunit release factors